MDADDGAMISGPAVRFVAEGVEGIASMALPYAAFDAILRAVHDLAFEERRIRPIALLRDWIDDVGLFDPEGGASAVPELAVTVAAVRLARDRIARRGGPDAVVADKLARFLADAEAAGLAVRVEPSTGTVEDREPFAS